MFVLKALLKLAIKILGIILILYQEIMKFVKAHLIILVELL